MAPPPPPPPPICFPFLGSKPKRRLSWTNSEGSVDSRPRDQLIRHPTYSPRSTMNSSVDGLTFHSDSEKYEEIPHNGPEVEFGGKNSRVKRSNTMMGSKKSTTPGKWGYGWGVGKQKEKQQEMERAMMQREGSMASQPDLPVYRPPQRSNTKSSQNTQSSSRTQDTARTQSTSKTQSTQKTQSTDRTKTSHHSRGTHRSGGGSGDVPRHIPSPRAHNIRSDSQSTLVGSALERKINDVDSVREKVDTTERLQELRTLMAKDDLDYYIVPSEDAHQSEYVSPSDRRREFISGFTGSAGQAIVSKTEAHLVTDSRYWLQARDQLDPNWQLVRAGSIDGPKDWIEWLVGRAKGAKIGIDARMISYEKATLLKSKVEPLGAKLHYPPQNLTDLVWKSKPPKSKEPLYTQPLEFAGKDAGYKLAKVREWVSQQAPTVPSYAKGPPTPAQMQAATLITELPHIAYLLNLRGTDVPYNPLFHAYLFVGLEMTVIFVDGSKVPTDVQEYLKAFNIERRDYTELWPFLRKKEWGEGKVILSPQTPYAIALMLTHFRITILPSHVDHMMSVKNEVELEGMRRAYLRDGASFVRFLAWLEAKLNEGYDISEYEAGARLTEFRRKNHHFMGLAYENISATGPNASLPHYSPKRATARMIDRETPYLNDSGGQYRDGTCDTTRTVHFGRPTAEQCEAYTRVLQGHIAIDSAFFPEGTSGHQLDVLARKALWKDGLNYGHGTGHGFGSFLTVHEGSHSFTSGVPLVAGHVITNEPGFYLDGKWGMRIESALIVKPVRPKHNPGGGVWLGFERLTCVPIQTRMVKENMLTKEEKQWLKDHNQKCYEKLSGILKDDKRALKWLKREAERGIGLATGPGGLAIDWD